MKISLILVSMMIMMGGCSAVINSHNSLPVVHKDSSTSKGVQNSDSVIAVFKLHNYTDTPRAGKRAANIAQGILLSEDYIVKNHIDNNDKTLQEMQEEAQKDGAIYFLTGGVSEWRYKTGIDGEPAVSIKLVLYRTEDLKVIWSATGSDSDWGISSVGTVAQKLLQKMIEA
jgi:uncharacterized protein YceK